MKKLQCVDKEIEVKVGDSIYLVCHNRINTGHYTILKLGSRYIELDGFTRINYRGVVDSKYSSNYSIYSTKDAWDYEVKTYKMKQELLNYINRHDFKDPTAIRRLYRTYYQIVEGGSNEQN